MILPVPCPRPRALHTLLHDRKGQHTRELVEADTTRTRLRTAVKHARKGGLDGDWTAAVAAATAYLPHLYALLAGVESDTLLSNPLPVFEWRSALSAPPMLKKLKSTSLPSLYFEQLATLLCLALSLSNAATALVHSLGAYEISRTLTTVEQKAYDATINKAAELLCRASGIMTYCQETVVPRWEYVVGVDTLAKRRPVEMTREGCRVLGAILLADANLLAIRRLLSRSRSIAHETVAPGPPLSSSHPSPSLLAKLYLHVHSLYSAARALSKSTPSTVGEEFNPQIRRYISSGHLLSLALAQKWLGIDDGENGGRERAGDAICWLDLARKTLEELGGSGLKGLRRGSKEKKGKMEDELESIQAFRSGYVKVNDTVYFTKVPVASSLQARIPSGRPALPPKPFVPPAPAFASAATPSSFSDGAPIELAGDSSDEEGSEGEYGGTDFW